jgi:hypothetical protein
LGDAGVRFEEAGNIKGDVFGFLINVLVDDALRNVKIFGVAA